MSKMQEKEIMNEVYDSVLVTTGVVGLSIVSIKLLKEKLTDATDLKDIAKLAAGVAGSTLLVKYLGNKKCGVISDNYLTNGGEWIENIWMKYKKSVHNKSKWIH